MTIQSETCGIEMRKQGSFNQSCLRTLFLRAGPIVVRLPLRMFNTATWKDSRTNVINGSFAT